MPNWVWYTLGAAVFGIIVVAVLAWSPFGGALVSGAGRGLRVSRIAALLATHGIVAAPSPQHSLERFVSSFKTIRHQDPVILKVEQITNQAKSRTGIGLGEVVGEEAFNRG
jgi:hypothetical protein